MNKTNIGLIIAISLLISLLTASAITTTNTFISGDFWNLNKHTVVLNNSSWNINLGENESTGYKLNIEGNQRINGQLIQNGTIEMDSRHGIDFMFDLAHMEFSIVNVFGNMVISSYKDLNITTLSNHDINIDSDKNINMVSDNTLEVTGNDIIFNGECVFRDNVSFNGNVSFSENLYVNHAKVGLNPLGTIIMWTGYGGNIPSGYSLCTGITVNGIYCPDLRGRFIIDNSSYFTRNSTGGSNTTTLSTTNLPSHTHTYGVDILTTRSYTLITGLVVVATGMLTSSGNTGSTGSATPFDNKPPYYTLTYLCFVGY